MPSPYAHTVSAHGIKEEGRSAGEARCMTYSRMAASVVNQPLVFLRPRMRPEQRRRSARGMEQWRRSANSATPSSWGGLHRTLERERVFTFTGVLPFLALVAPRSLGVPLRHR